MAGSCESLAAFDFPSLSFGPEGYKDGLINSL